MTIIRVFDLQNITIIRAFDLQNITIIRVFDLKNNNTIITLWLCFYTTPKRIARVATHVLGHPVVLMDTSMYVMSRASNAMTIKSDYAV